MQKTDEFEQEMKEQRQKQSKLLHELSQFVEETLNIIVTLFKKKQASQFDFFLHFLQQLLDEKSREVFLSQSINYKTVWQEFKNAVDLKRDQVIKKMRKLVDEAEVQLIRVSFGFEHVIPEFKQMYESLQSSFSGVKMEPRIADIRLLPEVVAFLIWKGYALELMDGDASNIPLSWIEAVFDSLIKLTGNKTVLTLFVLGIQSSGKSTLLNSMFGLEFAVKAGKCTSGVFMRLFPVPQGFPFDFILVIDTEGLTAPELALQKCAHDNELATLVIGLRDITLINIKGENTSEVQGVLQIAVHAFMKLMLVNEKIKLKHSCIFVHQNVSAIDAKIRLAYATQKTIDTLDTMTKEAAHQLNIADVNSFQEIIHFEVQMHVWYLPDLWLGDPPMTPTNPGYSNRVMELRSAILKEVNKRSCYLSLRDTVSRINDLWTGIMSEDFVFSFRNSLEIKAYDIMESKYKNQLIKLKKHIFNYVHKNANSKLTYCYAEDELTSVFQECKTNFRSSVLTIFDSLHKELVSFVDQNQYKDITIKWRVEMIQKFNVSKNECIEDAEKAMARKKETIRLRLINMNQLVADEPEINRLAKELALELKGCKPSQEELTDQFNKKWVTWMERYQPKNTTEEISLKQQINSALLDRLKKESSILGNEVLKKIQWNYTTLSHLSGSIHINQIMKQHLSIATTFGVIKSSTFENCAKVTLNMTNEILSTLDSMISSYVKQGDRFSIVYIAIPLDTLVNRFDSFNNNNQVFKILPTYIALCALHVCRFAEKVYEEMNVQYEQRHGWKVKMEEYKTNVWNIFNDATKDRTKEYIASSLLKNVLVALTIKHVKELIHFDLKQHMFSLCGSTKYDLLTLVLCSLADEGNFSRIRHYFRNAKDFSVQWFTQFAESSLFDKSFYCQSAKIHIQNAYDTMISSVESTRAMFDDDEEIVTEKWLNALIDTIKNSMPISILDFRNVISECSKIKGRVTEFSDLVISQLQSFRDEAIKPFTETNAHNITWSNGNPITEVFYQLWCCKEQCPFCHEPCRFTTKGHLCLHSCLQHKPAAIVGTYDINTNLLEINSCPLNVDNNTKMYNCSACHYQCRIDGNCTETGTEPCHYYHEYRKLFSSWDIPPDSTIQCSKYHQSLLSQKFLHHG